MKKLLLLATPLLVFGFEVQFSKKFSTQLVPNELSTTLNISSMKETEKEVLSSLDVYTRFLKKADYIEKKNNSLSVYPQYQYKDGNSILKGYKGSMRYEISSAKSTQIKRFLESFYELKKEKGLSLSLSSLKWSFSESMMKSIEEQLRLEAIKWSDDYAKTVSEDINKTCELQRVSLNSSAQRPRAYSAEMSMAKRSDEFSMSMPEQLQSEYTLNANIVMECE